MVFVWEKLDQYNRKQRLAVLLLERSFFENLDILNAFQHIEKNYSASSLTSLNFWKAESAFYSKKSVIFMKIDCLDRENCFYMY